MNIFDKLKDWELEIKVEKRRLVALLAFGIGICCMWMCSEEPLHWIDVLVTLIALIVYVGVSFVNLKLPDVWYNICAEIVLIICAVTCYGVMELIYFSTIRLWLWTLAINIVFIYLFVRLIYCLSKNLVISILLSLTCSYIWAIIAYYVNLLRGSPFLPWDIMAIGTAATVAGNFVYTIKKMFIYALMICTLAVLLTMMLKRKNKGKEKRNGKRIVMESAIILLGMIVYVVGINRNIESNLWQPAKTYSEQGILAGFLSYVKYCEADKIEGYSYKEIKEKITDAETIEIAGVEAKNIIVIMNETFADLRVINDELISDEYMPFVDSLNENTIKGNLYVPIFGGQTCDTEFEMLLGASTQYTSVTPYQTLMRKETESIVSYLKDRGYYTQAFHPYSAKNWNRHRVYGYMGFDEFLDIKAVEEMGYDGPYILRRYCSDEADYYKIIQEYEENKDEKYFMFNVTIQNHSGYDIEYEDLPSTVDLSAYGEYPLTEQYLTLIKKSDEAFQGLIEYFSGVEEPTLICMFGDHMPRIEPEFYSLLYGKEESELTESEKQQKYITPLIIWTNYDIEEKYLEKISANFLTLEILKAANIDIEGYWSVLNEVYEKYPVLAKSGMIDVEGNYYLADEMKEEEMIRLQRSIQYYRLLQK